MKKESVNSLIQDHIDEKRNEIIFALYYQKYNHVEIGRMFNRNRSTILRILEKMPKDYIPKWTKNP